LSIGQNLTIPTNCTTPDNTSCLSSGAAAAPVNQTCVVGPPSAYNVLFDDTFQKIASNFGLTEAALQKANPNVTASAIKENQILQIPVCPNSQCTVQTHIVQSGDLFVDLANKNGATVGQVLGLNAGINRFNLEVGQQIMIATKCGNATSS
jgi:LysM repeat protein